MELIKNYVVNKSSFKIHTRLSTKSESIVTFIQYGGKIQAQINADYTNIKELIDHYAEVYEICKAIDERESGWENVIDILLRDGFDIVKE